MNALIRVTSDIHCCGAVVRDGVVVECAPWIARAHRGRPASALIQHALHHGWRLEIYDEDAREWLPVH